MIQLLNLFIYFHLARGNGQKRSQFCIVVTIIADRNQLRIQKQDSEENINNINTKGKINNTSRDSIWSKISHRVNVAQRAQGTGGTKGRGR